MRFRNNIADCFFIIIVVVIAEYKIGNVNKLLTVPEKSAHYPSCYTAKLGRVTSKKSHDISLRIN